MGVPTRSATAGLTRMFRVNAAVGAAAWAPGAYFFEVDLASALLLLGPLVCVPLGLALLAEADRDLVWPRWRFGPRSPRHALRSPGKLWQLLGVMQLPAALCLLGAFAFPAGWLASLATLPWLGCTALVALLGCARILHGPGRVEEWGLSAGMVFLLVGGMWTLATRLGIQPLTCAPVIVLLTAVHFHFAGFVLPVLTGLAGRALPGRWARAASAGVLLGVPFVAGGIAVGRTLPLVEGLAAWFLVAAGGLVAGLYLRLALRGGSLGRRALFGAAGLSLAASLALAATYALGTYAETYWLSVDVMIPWHGLLNSAGFALPGLLAWQGQPRSST